MSKYDSSVKGAMAERVLGDDVFCETIQDMKWQYFQEWMLATTTNEREEIHAKLTGLLGVQAELDSLKQRHQMDLAAQAEQNDQETDDVSSNK